MIAQYANSSTKLLYQSIVSSVDKFSLLHRITLRLFHLTCNRHCSCEVLDKPLTLSKIEKFGKLRTRDPSPKSMQFTPVQVKHCECDMQYWTDNINTC